MCQHTVKPCNLDFLQIISVPWYAPSSADPTDASASLTALIGEGNRASLRDATLNRDIMNYEVAGLFNLGISILQVTLQSNAVQWQCNGRGRELLFFLLPTAPIVIYCHCHCHTYCQGNQCAHRGGLKDAFYYFRLFVDVKYRFWRLVKTVKNRLLVSFTSKRRVLVVDVENSLPPWCSLPPHCNFYCIRVGLCIFIF